MFGEGLLDSYLERTRFLQTKVEQPVLTGVNCVLIESKKILRVLDRVDVERLFPSRENIKLVVTV